jgi:hypothetical protein
MAAQDHASHHPQSQTPAVISFSVLSLQSAPFVCTSRVHRGYRARGSAHLERRASDSVTVPVYVMMRDEDRKRGGGGGRGRLGNVRGTDALLPVFHVTGCVGGEGERRGRE